MEEQKGTTSDVADLENRNTVCENGNAGPGTTEPDDLIDLLIKLGEEQEQIIALMKEALDTNDNEAVLNLAKELVYG